MYTSASKQTNMFVVFALQFHKYEYNGTFVSVAIGFDIDRKMGWRDS